jgi:membrane protein implicated in regulation of membrane protease activity
MLRQLVSLVLKREVADLKRRSGGGVLLVAGALLLMLSSLVALAGLYLWLSTRMAPWEAALIVAAVLLLSGLVLILAGRSMIRRQRARNDEIEALTQALLGKSGGVSGSGTQVGTVAAAALIGLVIGRSLHK